VHDRCRLPLVTKAYRPCCNASFDRFPRRSRTESRLTKRDTGFAKIELLGTSSAFFCFGRRRQGPVVGLTCFDIRHIRTHVWPSRKKQMQNHACLSHCAGEPTSARCLGSSLRLAVLDLLSFQNLKRESKRQ
jgi:hypothetical protein